MAHIMDGDALEQLAGCYGISTQFENAYGTHVAVDRQTIKLLLESMGVSVNNDIEAQTALEEFRRRAQENPLPAAVVVVPIDGACILYLKRERLLAHLEWRVVLESGGELTGKHYWADHSPFSDPVALPLHGLPLGYHRLFLPQLDFETHLIVSPGRCWLPDQAEGGIWGIAAQLYLLRSANNWGIGDFSDLRELIKLSAARGCDVIGVNPLHQMFLDDPEAASPYSPATRLYLNPLYIDVTAVPEWTQSSAAQAQANSEDFAQKLQRCRAAHLVDYTGVTALKIEALQLAYQTFLEHGTPERKATFATFVRERGQSLDRASLFQVMREHFSKTNPEDRDWRRWPVQFQSFASEAMDQFAAEHQADIQFQNWLQFIADEQLSRASDVANESGMAVGLYRDLAVGCAASGAETWANPPAFLQGNLVGAPPDIFNPAGQNWGLPPFDPVALAREGYRSFAELIRANMLHAGGLRIDHVMGLQRLFCIPEGKHAAEGAYVQFPIDDLLGVLALESQRQQCLVVGEDLGTVPSGFRERLTNANVLSYRVLFFEQDYHAGRFVPPGHYPQLAFSTTGSHDLPTLLAWWTADDLVLKDKLGLFPTPEETASQGERRAREKRNILSAFADAGLLSGPVDVESLSAEDFAILAHRYLALTPSMLLATQLDDITADRDPVNVPGTYLEHPNWRRKYRLSLEELAVDDDAWKLVAPLARANPHVP